MSQLWKCSRRGCGWIGTDEQKSRIPSPTAVGCLKVTTLICPDCACDSFYPAKPGDAPAKNQRAQVQSLFARYQDLTLLQRDSAICHFFGGLEEVMGHSARLIKRRPCNAADILHALDLAIEFGGKTS